MSVRHGTLTGYYGDSCRCDRCTAATALYEKRRRLDAIEGRPRTVDAIGPRRRIQALAVAGFPIRVVAEQLATEINRLHRAVNGKRLAVAKAREIAGVYRRLRFADPARYGVDPRQAARVTRMALAKGWAGPEAWEVSDIDDPDAPPEPPGSYCPRRSYEEIAEDALFVLATAGPLGRAAVAGRLGVQVRTLDRALASARERSAA